MPRALISELPSLIGSTIEVRGWVFRLRRLARSTFIILRECTGTVQCVIDPESIKGLDIGVEDAVCIEGLVVADARAPLGVEIQAVSISVLNRARRELPFHSNADISQVSSEVLLAHRSLTLRNERYTEIFRVQAAVLREFREFLTNSHFTEIVTSKIVSSGTEGGTSVFELRYFDRVAYLAQSPQFYKEQCVGAFERVFETGHVYRAEPHASSRHLTEYCSLDLEMGFVDTSEEIIELERRLLTAMFESLNTQFEGVLKRFGMPMLPSMLNVPIWEFRECLERLKLAHHRSDLSDDLDPEAERQLCALAEQETGVPAVFVLGFPTRTRPFYVKPRGTEGAGESFDLLFRGLEITTGGLRLHSRVALEEALRGRGIALNSFEDHLRMFELGMPPHGGLALGLERLTAQILGLSNVRETTLYPRDRYRVSP